MLSIFASSKSGSQINKIGKYLYKHIDGSFKIAFNAMECDVWMRMYYQEFDKPETLDEMHFDINITSYQNKIRINITEDTNLEKTIGQIILSESEVSNLELARKKILNRIKKFIDKEYSDYEFIY